MPRVLAAFVLAALVLAAGFGASADTPPQRAGRAGHHGAIAFHAASGQVGYSYDFREARAAKQAALAQCAHADCVVLVSFRDACGAIYNNARAGKGFGATGATRQEAETRARTRCKSEDCALVAWSCTR